MSLSPFAGFLQMAYVTPDFDAGLGLLRAHYGIASMLELRDLTIQVGPGRTAVTHVGLAWVGETQVELITPCGGDDAIYRGWLPQKGLRFHHCAQLLDSEAALAEQRAAMVSQDIAIAIEGASPGIASYFYSDHRAQLGHYVEHIYYTPEGRAVFDQIPRYAAR